MQDERKERKMVSDVMRVWLSVAEQEQFEEACNKQGHPPEWVIVQLALDYAETHNPRDKS